MEWKPGQIALGAVVGIAIGLALGQVHVRAAGGPDTAPAPAPTMRPPAFQSTDGVHPERPSNAAAVPTVAATKNAVDNASREAQLRTQIQELEKSLNQLKAAADPLSVPPLTRPNNLAPRFEEKALTQAAMDMIHEINPNADVTAVDCTEYPCIVYGTGLTIDQAKSLRSVSAIQAYEGDHGSMGLVNDTFSFWVVPKDDPNPLDAIDQRTSLRIAAMSASGRPR